MPFSQFPILPNFSNAVLAVLGSSPVAFKSLWYAKNLPPQVSYCGGRPVFRRIPCTGGQLPLYFENGQSAIFSISSNDVALPISFSASIHFLSFAPSATSPMIAAPAILQERTAIAA